MFDILGTTRMTIMNNIIKYVPYNKIIHVFMYLCLLVYIIYKLFFVWGNFFYSAILTFCSLCVHKMFVMPIKRMNNFFQPLFIDVFVCIYVWLFVAYKLFIYSQMVVLLCSCKLTITIIEVFVSGHIECDVIRIYVEWWNSTFL